MGPSGKYTTTGGGRCSCVGILSDGGEIGYIVWIRVVGHVKGDNEDIRGKPWNLPMADHREEGTKKHRPDMGDTSDQIGV